MNRKLRVFPRIFYTGPSQNDFRDIYDYLATITPAIFIQHHHQWGFMIGIIWLFWQFTIRFVFIDMDEIREVEELSQRDREEYNKKS